MSSFDRCGLAETEDRDRREAKVDYQKAKRINDEHPRTKESPRNGKTASTEQFEEQALNQS